MSDHDDEPAAPVVRPLVPDGPLVPTTENTPGWFWCENSNRVGWLKPTWVEEPYPGGMGPLRWHGPCLSLADVEAARREGVALAREQCADVLDAFVRSTEAYPRMVVTDELRRAAQSVDDYSPVLAKMRRLAAEMRGAK